LRTQGRFSWWVFLSCFIPEVVEFCLKLIGNLRILLFHAFQDYRFLEMELAGSYAPQNFYCYALDSKASPVFHKRMQALVSYLSTEMEFLSFNIFY
jgi:hypothetical protein